MFARIYLLPRCLRSRGFTSNHPPSYQIVFIPNSQLFSLPSVFYSPVFLCVVLYCLMLVLPAGHDLGNDVDIPSWRGCWHAPTQASHSISWWRNFLLYGNISWTEPIAQFISTFYKYIYFRKTNLKSICFSLKLNINEIIIPVIGLTDYN